MNSRRFIIDSFNMSDNSLSYPNKYDSWTVQNSETTHTQRLFVRIVNVQSLFISHYVDLWVLWIISLVFFLFLNFCTVSKVFGSKIWIKSKRYLNGILCFYIADDVQIRIQIRRSKRTLQKLYIMCHHKTHKPVTFHQGKTFSEDFICNLQRDALCSSFASLSHSIRSEFKLL